MNDNNESLQLHSTRIDYHPNKRSEIWMAFRTAFPYTLPIFAGFVFWGLPMESL